MRNIKEHMTHTLKSYLIIGIHQNTNENPIKIIILNSKVDKNTKYLCNSRKQTKLRTRNIY